jgi:hypothetical protein
MQLADKAGADDADANLSADWSGHQELPDFSSRRSFSSSRSRLYLVGSSIVCDGGAIGLRIFLINPPGRSFFDFRCGILLRGEADKAHLETCSLSASRPSREETIGSASSAWTDARDIRRRESRALELVADDGAQVDEGFAGTPCPRVIPRAINLPTETIAEIGVDFETTMADRWARRGANVGCASTELGHRMNARVGDIRDDPAPSGMQRAGYFSFRIDQQYRHAICREYSEHDAGLGSNDTVARRSKRGGVASRGVHDIAMHLIQPRDQLEVRHFAAQAIPVRIDSAFVVTDPM